MPSNNFNINGLNQHEVSEARKMHGANSQDFKKENSVWLAIKALAREPMVILLLITSSIYFLTGDNGDGFFMVAAVLLVATRDGYVKLAKFGTQRISRGDRPKKHIPFKSGNKVDNQQDSYHGRRGKADNTG